MAILVKTIKPQRFNDRAFRARIQSTARKVAGEMEKDFKATTATWKHKVKFEKLVDVAASPVQILVGTDDEIYGYVNNGTKPHPIFAGIYTGRSNKAVLAFPSAYKAKTQPRVIGSEGGGGFGDTVVVPFVQHPGTDARHFDEVIRDKWEPRFKREIESALAAGAKDSGHGA